METKWKKGDKVWWADTNYYYVIQVIVYQVVSIQVDGGPVKTRYRLMPADERDKPELIDVNHLAVLDEEWDVGDDDLFSTEAPTEAASVSASPIGEATVASTEEIIQPAENTDALFSDSAPTEVISEPSAEEADVAALDFDIPAQDAFAVAGTSPLTVEEPVPEEKPNRKDKKKKDKEKEKDEKKNKKKKDAPAEPKGFVPSSFKPKGDKTGAYAPTRSYQEDLFNEESSDDALLSDAAITTDDNTVSIPSSDPTPNGKGGGDDALIIARSSGFTDDDPDDPNGNGGGDGDLI